MIKKAAILSALLAAWAAYSADDGAAVANTGQPLRIEQVIQAICQNSDSVRMMKETSAKTEKMVSEKWSAALPVVSVSVNASRLYQQGLGARKDQSGPGLPAGVNGDDAVTWNALGGMFGAFTQSIELPIYSSSIQVTQALFTFGKIGTGIAVAHDFDSSVHCSYIRNVQQLQLTALDAFYRVALSEMALAVAEKSLARKKELSEFLNRNFALGSGSKAQLLATQADLKSQWADKITAAQNVRNARMYLSVLLGMALTDDIRIDTSDVLPTLLAMALPSENEAVASAVATRRDLRAMGFLADANRGGAKIFNAMYLPSIGAQASLGTGGSQAKDLYDWDRRNWAVGVGLQWTLFDGLANRSRAQQYQSDARKLDIAQQSIEKMISIEVKAALSECASADSGYAALKDMLAASQEGYDLTNENFKQGSGQFTELELAQERLRQAELGYTNARYRRLRSRAALRIAMGQDIVKVEEK